MTAEFLIFSLFDIIHLGLGVGPAFAMKINNESYFWAPVIKMALSRRSFFFRAFLEIMIIVYVDLKIWESISWF